MNVCPTCRRPLPRMANITDAQLDVLSAWWFSRSAKAAATLLGLSYQTVKNQLYSARKRSGVASNHHLAELYFGRLRSPEQLRTSHNTHRTVAA